jgi:hypothetical protein
MTKISVRCSDLTKAEWLALMQFSDLYKSNWKRNLIAALTSNDCSAELQSIREKRGVQWVETLTVKHIRWALSECE